MPLTQTPSEEQARAAASCAPPATTPPVLQAETQIPEAETTRQGASLDLDGPRYDAAAVQQILALAQQMQSKHRETLTAEDVEALGHEVGIEPEFMRRALRHIESQTTTQGSTTTQIETKRRKQGTAEGVLPSLSRRQWVMGALPAALYALLIPLTFKAIGTDEAGTLWLYLALPILLMFSVGFKSGRKRVGALGGGLLALASILAYMANDSYHQGSSTHLLDFCIILAIWGTFGVSLGCTGAALRESTREIRERRAPRKRVRMESEGTKRDAAHEEELGDWV